ncbi:MAG: DegT/DnrJ/EryC1/StrS family aminotransferase [Actinomycetota bacterium]|nr:DegT/DnrJ/EryC1/StrS family aminotransferase [Actinomycetota bacterium]MDQ2955592.1 DegT/DnrJ/EryC1/StrS family aminotransferase [Actinomycetota bacterium]
MGQPELDAIAEVFASGWLAGNGPTSRRFEAAFAELSGVSHTLAVANCTAALHLAFLALKLGPGDEVVVADYTFPATGHAVMMTGAKPVFADVRPDIWTVEPAAVEAAITAKTVGIVAVDVFGQAADYDELQAIADRHGLWLVEDAAAASGALYKGRPAGSLADAGCFSFHGRKGITSGEGGALTTDNAELDAHARKAHAFGIESALSRAASDDLPVPEFDELGYNYKLSDVAAAMMLVQLGRLPDLIKARQAVAEGYAERLADSELITLPVTAPDRVHVWQSYVLTLDESVNRGAVAHRLRTAGVQCTFGTYASHVQPIYGPSPACPVSASLFTRHLAIPMHANLTGEQVDRVADAVLAAVTGS